MRSERGSNFLSYLSYLSKQSIGLETKNIMYEQTQANGHSPIDCEIASELGAFCSWVMPGSMRFFTRFGLVPRTEIALYLNDDLQNCAMFALGLVGALSLVPRDSVNNVMGMDLTAPFVISTVFGVKTSANMITHHIRNVLERPRASSTS